MRVTIHCGICGRFVAKPYLEPLHIFTVYPEDILGTCKEHGLVDCTQSEPITEPGDEQFERFE